MAHTKVTKTGTQNNGTANTFSYSGSFDVFKASEVQVTLDNIVLTLTTSTINESASPREYTVDYANSTVHIGGANLTSSDNVVIQPVTDMGDPTPRATYAPGASVTSDDLNNNQLQLMRKAMEYNEQMLSSLGGTMTGNLHLGQNVDITFEGDNDNLYETTLTVADPTSDKTITFPDTTGTVVTTGDTGSVATGMIAADAVTGAKIADDQINSEHYVDGSIDTAHIADSQITSAKIANGTIVAGDLASDAVTTVKITDLNVTTAKIASQAVTNAKLAGLSVATANIIDGNVTTAKLATDAVTTAKITDLNVTTAKIAADAITGAKIADDQINSEHYVDASIDHAHLSNDCIDGDNIQDDVINSEHYAADSIDTEHYAPNSVDTTALAADAVTGAQIADDSVDSEHIVADSLDTEHYAPTSIDSAALASNAVTETKITDANVTEAKLAANSVTISKIGCEQTTISDSDSHIPTSGAVVDYVAAQIAPIGGLEVIADEDNFPTSQPASGVVISISDAAGIVVQDGSGGTTAGRSTTARTAGNGSDNVTINNFPSSLHGETLATGVGLMVTSTGSSNTYNYHKILAAETDVKQLSDDINDFNARYRVGSSNPSSALDSGDLFFNTGTGKLLVYNGTNSAWEEAQSIGNYYINTISSYSGTGGNSASFNGSAYRFVLSNAGTTAEQHIVSVNGVIQKPNSGTSQPSEGFAIDGSSIIFGAAPATGSDYFIITIGSTVNIGTPTDGTVTAAKIASGAVETAKIADGAVNSAKILDGTIVNADINASAAIATSKISGLATSATTDTTNASNIGSGSLANARLTKPIDFADNEKARFGNSNDLEVYHAGDHSYISDTGTGQLRLRSNDLRLQDTSGNAGVQVLEGGAVYLYHSGSQKFATTSAGIEVTSALGIANVGGTLAGSGGTENWLGIKDSSGNWRVITKTHGTNVGGVGIGTTTPSDNLHIADSGANEVYVRLSNSTISNGWSIGPRGSDGRFQIVQNGVRDSFFIDTSGNATVNSGNLVIGTSGKGIDFSQTSNSGGSMTSELLDDYEEGTWTPNSNDLTVTNNYTAKYTKIGRFCHVTFDFTYSGSADSSQSTLLTGLPYTADGTQSFGNRYLYITDSGDGTGDDGDDRTLPYIANSDSKIIFWNNESGHIRTRAWAVSRRIRGSLTYRTT